MWLHDAINPEQVLHHHRSAPGWYGGTGTTPSFIVPAFEFHINEKGILQTLNIVRIAPEMNRCDPNRNSDHPEYALRFPDLMPGSLRYAGDLSGLISSCAAQVLLKRYARRQNEKK